MTNVHVDNEVFGDVVGIRTGSCAEYLVVDSRVICLKPKNITHIQAAGAPLAGITALQCFEACHFKEGGRVLITGGAGGVGGYAIQIAKNYYKASYIATTGSSGKFSYLKQLGAHEVFDYHLTSPNDIVSVCQDKQIYFDCIIDCTGEAGKLVPLVKDSGGLVSILSYPTSEILNAWLDGSVGPGVSISPVITTAVWGLGSIVDFFTGAGAISNTLSYINATFKHIITIPNASM